MSVCGSQNFPQYGIIRTNIPLEGEVKTMLINKAYKFRIYPTEQQEILIAKTIGCCRFVFNRFLGQWNDKYKATGN
jgi:putative transposase